MRQCLLIDLALTHRGLPILKIKKSLLVVKRHENNKGLICIGFFLLHSFLTIRSGELTQMFIMLDIIHILVP